ncbi:MAG: major capsid protein [Fusobacterium sp.]|nr:major capsid protein [Fusobacterium sp.]
MDKVFGITALTTVVERIKNPKSALWDILIGSEKAERTQNFEVHTRDEGRLRAPLVGKREGSIFIEKGAFKTAVYTPPMIKLHTINLAEDMLTQKFGQTQYGDAQAAWKNQLADDITKLKNIAFRTKTWMLTQLFKTGICPTADGAEGVKFGEFSKIVLSGTSCFDSEESDPIAWLKEKQEEVQQKTGIILDTVITTPKVAGALHKHPIVKEYLKQNNANMYLINDKTTEKSNGEKLEAYLPTLGIKIYSFVDWAKDISSDKEEAVLEEKHLLFAKRGGFKAQYGAMPLRAKQGERAKLFINKEVVRTWYPEASEDEQLQYFSAPLISPLDAQGWVYAQVIA